MSKRTQAISLVLAMIAGSSNMAIASPPCPPREAGQAFPWQDLAPMKGDQSAIVYVSVDKTGRALKCWLGKNDIPDPETRFRVCQSYMQDWHAAPATEGDPALRTIRRDFTMLGSAHQAADQKARRAWFKAHPDERQACYPE